MWRMRLWWFALNAVGCGFTLGAAHLRQEAGTVTFVIGVIGVLQFLAVADAWKGSKEGFGGGLLLTCFAGLSGGMVTILLIPREVALRISTLGVWLCLSLGCMVGVVMAYSNRRRVMRIHTP